MIAPQTMNAPLVGFHSFSIICQAIKLFMEDMRNRRQVYAQIHLELTGFLFCLELCFTVNPWE